MTLWWAGITGRRDEFSGDTFARWESLGKLSDFLVVLDGDSRGMENDLKATGAGIWATRYSRCFYQERSLQSIGCGKTLQGPIRMTMRAEFGVSGADMVAMTHNLSNLVAGRRFNGEMKQRLHSGRLPMRLGRRVTRCCARGRQNGSE